MKTLLTLLCIPLALATKPGAAALPPNAAPFPGTAEDRPEALPDISEVRLERTRCLAGCPAYTLVVRADGSFRYTGEAAVERLGEYTGQVDVGQLRQIFRYIDEIEFGALERTYLSPYLDNAATIITVVQDGEAKTVTNYANSGPATLWALGQLLDGLLETATWHPGGGQR